jgi:hypothetical protein
MDLTAFQNQYSKPGTIILLEGKRVVKEADAAYLSALGKMLALSLPEARFRSGNAPGADALFTEGVVSVDASRMELMLPYSGHRKKYTSGIQTHPLDQINLVAEPEVVYQTAQHKNSRNLVQRYLDGKRDQAAMKASYLLRDTVKVLGAAGIPPATVGLFYVDLQDPDSGGTGHTMRVCRDMGIPVFDQTTWLPWL